MRKVQVIHHAEFTRENSISTFMHCGKCLEEKPDNVSPKDWARTQTGVTEKGWIQVWCNRHECNVTLMEVKAKLPQPRKPSNVACFLECLKSSISDFQQSRIAD